MSSPLKIDTSAVRQLAEILNDTNLTEIEYNNSDTTIRVAREVHVQQSPMTFAPSMVLPSSGASASSQATPAATAPQPEAVSDLTLHKGCVKSPMVGTAYLSPEPGAAAFIKVGDSVKEGQTLLIIEAMKVMNPIKAPKAGKIIHIFIQDSLPIEFGEPLVVID
ncbi:MAG TPA: acetyl-CoA carboxylase biotin carboxyl carrier protein [Alphaproteobacteria bacterium]|nr:acetyl-CoA carboxylase biotin carboxyl carrier protein [Alphaproteobacteria bacterium]